MDWAHVEARVEAQCGRPLRVFGSGSAADVGSAGVTTGDALSSFDKQQQIPLGLFLELPYALRVALGARVDVWLQPHNCASKVQTVTWYLTSRAQEDEELRISESDGDASLRSALHALSSALGVDVSVDNWQQEAIVQLLVDVVQKLVAWFVSLQVQNLRALNIRRTSFEHELLQHQLQLETLVTSSHQRSLHFVDFVLPLFGEEPSWNEGAAVGGLSADSFHLPDTFNHPNFARGSMDKIVLQTRLEMDKQDAALASSVDWKYTVHWPSAMALSSQVTQIPHTSRKSSSVELVATCKENILSQWHMRRDFIAQLRSKVIVLEYEAVDFSSAVLMLQEQRDEYSPLRIVLLRLRFTVEYFLTNCFSDLQVTLLHGISLDAPVPIRLDPSPSSTDSPDAATEKIVAAFLESMRRSLLTYFYGSRSSRRCHGWLDPPVGSPDESSDFTTSKLTSQKTRAMMENMMKNLIGKGKSEEDERKQKKSDSSYQCGSEYSTGDSSRDQDSSSYSYGHHSKYQRAGHRDTRTPDYLGGSSQSDDPSASSSYSTRSDASGYSTRKKRSSDNDGDDDSSYSKGYGADDSTGSSYQSEYMSGYQSQSSSRSESSPYQSSSTSKKRDQSSSSSSRGISYGSGCDDSSYTSGSYSKQYDDDD